MDKFHSKHTPVDRGYPSLCWIWNAAKDKDGYGQFALHRQVNAAHRVAWLLRHGWLPPYPESELDHLCRNRDCVNPEHLQVVSHRENSLRSESFAALNAQKTVCAKGHEYSEENTYIRPNGARDCRACIRDRVRRYQGKRATA